MLKLITKVFVSIALFFTISIAQTRFIDNIFTNIDSTKNIQYCITTYASSTDDTLSLDYFEPSGDLMQNRPLLVVIHGGSFSDGVRNDNFCVTYEQTFSKKGYCVASIDYRTKLGIISISNAKKQFATSIYNAVQDARSAVRFFKANAETYKIDTNRVFLCGYSAGAVTAIQYAHMQMSEFIDFLDGELSYVELLDIRNNLNVSASIKGYVSYAGAVIDTSWIQTGNVPFIAFHGTNDNVIRYSSGSPFGIAAFPVIYGSSPMHTTGDRLGITNKLITYTDSTHTFVNSPLLLQQSIDSAAAFLYPLLGITSVKDQNYSIKSNNKSTDLTNVNKNKNVCLNGRSFEGSKNSSNVYISNKRNIVSTSTVSRNLIINR